MGINSGHFKTAYINKKPTMLKDSLEQSGKISGKFALCSVGGGLFVLQEYLIQVDY